MKRYIKSTSYKSGDRYYGGLPQEPSSDKLGKAYDDARTSFEKFLTENNVTVIDVDSHGHGTKTQSYIWKTPDNREIEIIYYNRGSLGGSEISEMYIEDNSGYHKVNVYESKYNGWQTLRDASIQAIITSLNTDNGKLSLVYC